MSEAHQATKDAMRSAGSQATPDCTTAQIRRIFKNIPIVEYTMTEEDIKRATQKLKENDTPQTTAEFFRRMRESEPETVEPDAIVDMPSKPTRAGDKYRKSITCIDTAQTVTVDVYAVLRAFGPLDPAIDHAIKKLLCAGNRKKNDYVSDLNEAVESIQCAIRDHLGIGLLSEAPRDYTE